MVIGWWSNGLVFFSLANLIDCYLDSWSFYSIFESTDRSLVLRKSTIDWGIYYPIIWYDTRLVHQMRWNLKGGWKIQAISNSQAWSWKFETISTLSSYARQIFPGQSCIWCQFNSLILTYRRRYFPDHGATMRQCDSVTVLHYLLWSKSNEIPISNFSGGTCFRRHRHEGNRS